MAGPRNPAYTLKVEGITQLVAKLEADEILSKPMRRAFSRIGIQGKTAAKLAAPYAQGGLRGSISTRMSSAKVPTFVAVVVRANRNGYPYPRLLEFSNRHHHFHWLGNAVAGIMSGVSTFLEDAAREMEQQFARKGPGL